MEKFYWLLGWLTIFLSTRTVYVDTALPPQQLGRAVATSKGMLNLYCAVNVAFFHFWGGRG
jgi:hypothetical protein